MLSISSPSPNTVYLYLYNRFCFPDENFIFFHLPLDDTQCTLTLVFHRGRSPVAGHSYCGTLPAYLCLKEGWTDRRYISHCTTSIFGDISQSISVLFWYQFNSRISSSFSLFFNKVNSVCFIRFNADRHANAGDILIRSIVK